MLLFITPLNLKIIGNTIILLKYYIVIIVNLKKKE